MPSEKPSILLTLAAQAVSTVGLSVSIIAWLWLSLIPLPKPTEPITIVDKKARRRSAPAALQSQSSSHSPPSPQRSSVDHASLITIPPRKRRVYFADSPNSPSRPSSRPNDSAELIVEKPIIAQSSAVEISPASSSSTLVHTHTAIPPQTLETCRELAIESDSSSSSSPRRSLSLTRPFGRTRRTSGPDVPAPELVSEPRQPRRSSGNFVPPWTTFRRTSTSKSASSNASSTPSSGTTSSPSPTSAPAQSYFTRKSARRVSTPVPRTQPYAYPYFAEPPKVDDDVYIAYLRGRTPPGPETLARSATASDSEGGKSQNRKLNDKAQAALGLQRPSTLQQRNPKRSASEGWVERP
ncbi:hypothetical protein MIND_00511300 [Mycena indigotica]|uniref:Uncharacterized protein n=1 Tax=Mycena indigotica TaxID=2126181 RepID=A0A8H6SYL8_9AGAR|nr:uncharacterized protein MIND_00511300 [Mycena indigotica]KAF7307177.1 hypothetical protein MIND_00511300 [Mycena indigotica]